MLELNVITFDLESRRYGLSHHITFQIQVITNGKTIYCTIIDEGASTYIMSISCWRAIGSTKIIPLQAFNGHEFLPHGILTAFPIELGGKIVSVDMELVDSHLEYNILLVLSWFYAMMVVASSVFRVLCSPHQGCIVTID
jgi:hypothetical protein